MATDHIRYDVLARDALRGVLRKVLSDAAAHGFLGEQIVADMIDGHRVSLVESNSLHDSAERDPKEGTGQKHKFSGELSGGFCCQVPPNPA